MRDPGLPRRDQVHQWGTESTNWNSVRAMRGIGLPTRGQGQPDEGPGLPKKCLSQFRSVLLYDTQLSVLPFIVFLGPSFSEDLTVLVIPSLYVLLIWWMAPSLPIVLASGYAVLHYTLHHRTYANIPRDSTNGPVIYAWNYWEVSCTKRMDLVNLQKTCFRLRNINNTLHFLQRRRGGDWKSNGLEHTR